MSSRYTSNVRVTQLNSKTQIFESWRKLHADHVVQRYVAQFAVVSQLLRDRLIFR
jgi:hypothetical protein